MSGILDDFRNAFTKRNNGLVQIILINVVVFLVCAIIGTILFFAKIDDSIIVNQLSLSSSLPYLLTHPWTLITNFFTHFGFFHILFNMLFLYWFGLLIEEYLGGRRLINLYILGGLFSSVIYLIAYNTIPTLMGVSTVVGASGAIFAVVVGAATLLPDYTLFLFLIGPVKIKYIAIFYVVLSFVELRFSNTGGNLVHLGGALLGFIYVRQLQGGRDLGAPIDATLNFFKNLFKKNETPTVNVTYRSQRQNSYSNAAPAGFPDDDEVDEILDKISKSGYESLSKDEKQKLFKASQKS
jgi:membrane associated rhomboid family serine protease